MTLIFDLINFYYSCGESDEQLFLILGIVE